MKPKISNALAKFGLKLNPPPKFISPSDSGLLRYQPMPKDSKKKINCFDVIFENLVCLIIITIGIKQQKRPRKAVYFPKV